MAKLDLHRIVRQPFCHIEVQPHLFRRACAQIPLREPRQKRLHLGASPRQQRRHAVHQLLANPHSHALVVHAAVQIAGRGQIQPPQVLRLPRRQRVRMHRLNVRVGEQRQHAQRLQRLHLPRERPHRIQIENISPQRGAHLQMVADQPQHQLALVRIQHQPPGHVLRHLRALQRVVVAASSLPRIVQQRRQEHQLRVLHIAQYAAKPSRPHAHLPGLRLLQPVQSIDHNQGVLIHRVAVVRIADHQRVNPVELRQQQLQNPQRVHHAQRLARKEPQQDLLHVPPQRRPLLQMRRQQRQGLRDPLLAPAFQPAPAPRHRRKQLQHHVRVLGRISRPLGRFIQHRSPARHAEAHRRGLCPAPRLGKCSLRRCGPAHLARLVASGLFQHLGQAALHAARVAEVEPHPVRRLHAFRRRVRQLLQPPRSHSDPHRRRRILAVPVQRIVVPLMPVVQKTSHREQESHRLTKLLPVARQSAARQSAVHQSAARALRLRRAASPPHILQPLQPSAHMHVPQTAGTVLDARLQVERRIPVLGMTLAGQLHQSGGQRLVLPLQHLGKTHIRHPPVHRLLARQQPVVQQRHGELRVLRVEALRLAAFPAGRRKPEPAVPKLLADPPDRLLDLRLRHLPIQQVQQVHIRVGKQLPAPVSAHRQHGDPAAQHRRLHHRLLPQPHNQLIHRRRARRHRHRAGRTRCKRAANLQHPPLVLPAQPFACGLAFLHGCAPVCLNGCD